VGIYLALTPPRVARLALALLAFAALALAGALPAATAGASGSIAHASRGTHVIVKTYKVVPRPQRTVRHTGYATYVFSAPAGHRIVSATARVVGAQRHAVAISARAITNQLTRYTVKLVFPGEQGNPGKLVVRLALL
jgi:hypothetical protein